MMLISICVVTYKRPEGLRRLLDCLISQETEMDVEVLVVDNDMARSANWVVNKYSDQKILYYLNDINNISSARNLAVSKASGEYIVFIDDDSMPKRHDWLSTFIECCYESCADILHGPVDPFYVADVEPWVKRSKYFERPNTHRGACNSCIKTNALNDTSVYFSEYFGKTGGEDSLFFDELASAGCTFAWCKDAVVYEFYDSQRCNVRWMLKRAFRGGNTHFKKKKYLGTLARRDIVYSFVVVSGLFFLAPLWSILGLFSLPRFTYLMTKFFEYIGRLSYLCKMEYEEYGN